MDELVAIISIIRIMVQQSAMVRGILANPSRTTLKEFASNETCMENRLDLWSV